MYLITNCHVLREMNLTMNNSFNIFRFKIKARDLTTHQIPLHSGEPRAQHAPRGPDGCLLPSLQLPLSPPHPTPTSSYRPHPPHGLPAPHQYSLKSWSSLSHCGTTHLSSMRAQTQTHTHALHWTTINFTRRTHDLHAVFSVGTPSACFLVVSVQLKQTTTPLPFGKSMLQLSPSAWLLDILASKLSLDACLSILILYGDDETKLSLLMEDERCLSGRTDCVTPSTRFHFDERISRWISNSWRWKTHIGNLKKHIVHVDWTSQHRST